MVTEVYLSKLIFSELPRIYISNRDALFFSPYICIVTPFCNGSLSKILTFLEVSEIDSFLVEGSEEGEVGPEPEYLLPRTPPLSPASQNQEQTHDMH